jgi:integrase
MRGKISKRSVDALQLPAGKAEVVLWDSDLKGFGVRLQRKEGARTYVLHYRHAGKLRKLKIGRHGRLTPEQARREAKRLLGQVAEGKDPAADKAAAKAAPTISKFATTFLTEHVEVKRKASTAREYRRLLEHVIVPALGKKQVVEVKRQDVTKLHHALRKTPIEANRALALLSTMMTFAEKSGVLPDGSTNPCRHVERYQQRRRERFLSPEELARLGDALSAYDGSPYIVAAIKLLVFTGARLGEVLGLQWEWIDFDRGEARLPDSKTGAKTLYLPPPALEVLSELSRIDGNPYVIVGKKEGAALVNLEKPWRAIRKVAGLQDVRLHDLRHAFASVAASSGMGLPIIGKMLGHTQAQTTQRYAHLASDPVKAAAAAVAGKIAASMTRTGGPSVTKLRSDK